MAATPDIKIKASFDGFLAGLENAALNLQAMTIFAEALTLEPGVSERLAEIDKAMEGEPAPTPEEHEGYAERRAEILSEMLNHAVAVIWTDREHAALD